jgi:hypothetical protein
MPVALRANCFALPRRYTGVAISMVTAHSIQNNPVARELEKVWKRSSASSQAILAAVMVASYMTFWWIAKPAAMTRSRGYDGNFLAGPNAFGHIIVIAAMVLAATCVWTVLAGFIRPDVGLFAAAIGLLALSNRGHAIYSVIQGADGQSSVYLSLAISLVLLYAMLAAGGWIIRRLVRSGKLKSDADRDGLADVDQQPGAGWAALLSHALIMSAVIVLVGQSEDKKQVLAAVLIGSFCGAFFPYTQAPARPSAWYWLGPLLVGLVGYAVAYLNPPVGILIGRPGIGGGFLAALARPLPLDYASLGTAGALLGYWMRRKSVRERELHDATENAPPESGTSTAQ